MATDYLLTLDGIDGEIMIEHSKLIEGQSQSSGSSHGAGGGGGAGKVHFSDMHFLAKSAVLVGAVFSGL